MSPGEFRLEADWQAGLAVNFRQYKITSSRAARTKDFYGQAKRPVFGSISITYSRPLEARPLKNK